MTTFEIIITIFVVGGILYNFQTSAEERGIDLFGMLYGMLRGIFLLLAYPILLMIEKSKKRKD